MTIFEIMKHCLLLRGAPLENSYRHAINKKLHTSILLQIVIKIIRKFFFLAQFLCYFIISKEFSVTNAKLKQFTGHKNQNEKLTGTHKYYVFNQAENKQTYAM